MTINLQIQPLAAQQTNPRFALAHVSQIEPLYILNNNHARHSLVRQRLARRAEIAPFPRRGTAEILIDCAAAAGTIGKIAGSPPFSEYFTRNCSFYPPEAANARPDVTNKTISLLRCVSMQQTDRNIRIAVTTVSVILELPQFLLCRNC